MYLPLLFYSHCHHIRSGLIIYTSSIISVSCLDSCLQGTHYKSYCSAPKLSMVHTVKKQTKLKPLVLGIQNPTKSGPVYFCNFLPLFLYNLHESLAPKAIDLLIFLSQTNIQALFPLLPTSIHNYIESLFQYFPNISLHWLNEFM